MPQIIFPILALLLICIVIIVAIQRYLLKQSSKITQKLEEIPGFQGSVFNNIASNLQDVFYNEIIPSSRKLKFQEYYAPYFYKADSLEKKLRKFFLRPTQFLKQFVAEYKDLDRLVEEHNNTVIQDLLTKHKQYFDTCLTYPLDNQQRRAIISEEDNCLVISSAGSGKTSSIVGKVKYLTEIKGVSPDRILLISYTNKAASELSERIDTEGLDGYTFHKLALEIIGKSTGVKPTICSNTDALFVDIYRKLFKKRSFKRNVVEYFMNYDIDENAIGEMIDSIIIASKTINSSK
jgi:DNA helicase-4